MFNFLNYVDLFDNVLWLYNGRDLGYDDDIPFWLSEEFDRFDLSDDKIEFVEKQYGYLRSLIDQDVDDQIIVDIGKYMLQHDICDSKDFTPKDIRNLNIENDPSLVEILLEEGIWIDQQLIDQLQQYNRCVLVGGGRDECLKEIELLCDIADIEYDVNNSYVY